MCDCYAHKCRLCNEVIPMHLGDFNTGRSEIDVYCWRHAFAEIRSDLDTAIIYLFDKYPLSNLYKSDKEGGGHRFIESKSEADYYRDKFIIVDSLTDNAWENRHQNHPNSMIDFASIEVCTLKEFFLVGGERSK